MSSGSRRSLQLRHRRNQKLEIKSKIIRQLTGLRVHPSHVARVNSIYFQIVEKKP